MDCFDNPFLLAPLFFIFNKLMNKFLYREGIQGIEQYLLFMRITAILAYVCVAVVEFFVSLLVFDFNDKEQIFSKLGSNVFVSTGWKESEVEDHLSNIVLVELHLLLACICTSIANQVWVRFHRFMKVANSFEKGLAIGLAIKDLWRVSGSSE